MLMKRSLAITLVLGLLLIGFLTYKKINTVKFTILHTNDHHGRFWKNSKGKYGMAARSTIINRIRRQAKKKKREFLLLSAGDVNTGTFESDLLKAKPDFLAMNALGYDAMTVGNNELLRLPMERIRELSQQSKVPWLLLNIEEADGSQSLSQEMFIYPLIKAIQELSAKNEALLTRIEALEG